VPLALIALVHVRHALHHLTCAAGAYRTHSRVQAHVTVRHLRPHGPRQFMSQGSLHFGRAPLVEPAPLLRPTTRNEPLVSKAVEGSPGAIVRPPAGTLARDSAVERLNDS
jgi:hypothetical protein